MEKNSSSLTNKFQNCCSPNLGGPTCFCKKQVKWYSFNKELSSQEHKHGKNWAHPKQNWYRSKNIVLVGLGSKILDNTIVHSFLDDLIECIVSSRSQSPNE